VPDSDLPWAEYILPIGYAFTPTVTGDVVWVEFPYTNADGSPDTRRPVIAGAAQDAPGGIPNVAPEASGKGDIWTPDEVEGAPPRPTLTSSEDYVVHRNNVLELRTVGGGYEIANTAAGSRIGMNEAGQIYLIGPADVFVSAGGNLKWLTTGDMEFVAGGTFNATAKEFKFTQG
jgi:hypothetical protein